jgi:hypothetical protein
MRARDDKSAGLIHAALLAVVVALVGVAGAVKIAQSASELGPAVGDIVQFDPKGYIPLDVRTRIAATRADASACTLDLDTIHRAGGSLIVEQRLPADDARLYRVHWAGQRSASGAADCGANADLTLDDANLDMLAMAAGGWGVGHKHVAAGDVWGSTVPMGPVR